MTTKERKALAAQIVAELLADMVRRRGFRQNWDAIDREIREEIIDAWCAVVERRIEAAGC